MTSTVFEILPLLKWTWLPVTLRTHFWQWSLNYKPCMLSNLCINLSLLNHALFMSYRYYKGFKQQKWPSHSLKFIGTHAIRQAIYDFLFVFRYNYVSILHRFWDIIAHFPEFKDAKCSGSERKGAKGDMCRGQHFEGQMQKIKNTEKVNLSNRIQIMNRWLIAIR